HHGRTGDAGAQGQGRRAERTHGGGQSTDQKDEGGLSMASRKTRAKRRQERMQQLQRSAVASPAQMRSEELNALKEIQPLEEQPASLQDEWEPIPAKEVEQRIECVPL